MHRAPRFRFNAAGWHLAASFTALTLVLGGLYLGWYRWPGWYLADAQKIVPILVVVDLALGPLVTLLIANPAKPRRELARDIAIIALVQLLALGYGATALWRGRPLYYAFSEDRLQLVTASDLDASEIALAARANPQFVPHWYSLPRRVWAPLPADAGERQAIVASAVFGGNDVIQMPRYFRAWQAGEATLRARLLPLERQRDLRISVHRKPLRERMLAAGFAPDQPVTLLVTGHGAPMLAVFDRDTLQVRGYLRSEP
jgi:hypothetical protein